MSLISRFFPSFLNISSKLPVMQNASKFHSVASTTVQNTPVVSPGGTYSLVTRSVVRCHFPRPSERRRVTRHGWQKRMSTPSGRRVLMNRILKGRWIYSH